MLADEHGTSAMWSVGAAACRIVCSLTDGGHPAHLEGEINPTAPERSHALLLSCLFSTAGHWS